LQIKEQGKIMTEKKRIGELLVENGYVTPN
jgi:hypothetical protein